MSTTAKEESSSLKQQQQSAKEAGTNKRKEPTPFCPQDDWQLVSQGAEARLWKIPSSSSSHEDNNNDDDYPVNNQDAYIMAKERFSKKYRHPVLDERLTKQRCRMEGRLLEKCRQQGLAVPRVRRVEAPVLYMEYIDGKTVRNVFQEWIEGSSSSPDGTALSTSVQSKVNFVANIMGTMIGKLHSLGIVHGDLTTSNMMMRKTDRNNDDDNNNSRDDDSDIVLIDFGLAKNSALDEDRAVDLYVLERALASTHPWLPETFMDDQILPAYAKQAPKADKVLQRLEQVRLRGRKRECFG